MRISNFGLRGKMMEQFWIDSSEGKLKSALRNLKSAILPCTILIALGVSAPAQQTSKVPRIGILRIGSPPDQLIDDFRDELSKLGYLEGQNIAIEYRYTKGKEAQLRDLIAELVRRKVDVIMAPGGTAARAAKESTNTIPIVITAVADPVGEGLVSSLARPGGNITGLSNLSPDLSGKRLEILKETFPKITRLAILVTPTEEGGQLKAAADLARRLKLQIYVFEVHTLNDLENAFKAMTKQPADALFVLGSAIIFEHRKLLAELVAKTRWPAMFPHIGFVEAGGLMSYGPNFSDLYRRAAVYVDKILKGTKPADLPVEQPRKFDFVINLKTAKTLNLTIPQSVLYRADKVIK
jgi:putative ABC transport system substrate-binding protein